MSRWGNSKALTQASYGLVKEHPQMNRWAVRAAVHGAVVGGLGVLVGVGLVVAGGVTSESAGSGGSAIGLVGLVLGAVIVVASVVAGLTAANLQLAGLVSAADDVLHGRELDEQAAKAAAQSRLGTLAAWSGISVAVGALVSMIRGDGGGGVAAIVRALLAGLVAAVWAVITTLVLPVIVLEDRSAVAAIKRSSELIRATWGEAVLGSVRIGARFALMFTLPGVALLIGGVVLGAAVGGPAAIAAGAVLAVLGIALVVVGAVKAATCRNVFGVALYRWTTGEGALGPFSEEDLRGAVSVKGGSVPAGI
jgi:hypothetical protein